jgi:hypothetical protein
MPVIPLFDGWFAKPDGTADLCFGYFNLNIEEALEIPIGPDNYITPERYNGVQPTFFHELPGYAERHYCWFTVNVPKGSTERVTWHLRRNLNTYSVPAHSESYYYQMDDIFFPTDRGDPGGSMSPILKFTAPVSSPEGIGRGNPVRISTTAKVGTPITLTLSVMQPTAQQYPVVAPYTGEPKAFTVYWWKYTGPLGAVVTFSLDEQRLTAEQHSATTTATFPEPGRYVLLGQAMNGGFDNQCCWTNAYVDVTVTP